MKPKRTSRRCLLLIATLMVALSFESHAATYLEIEAEEGNFLFGTASINVSNQDGQFPMHFTAPNQLYGSFVPTDTNQKSIQLIFYSGAQRAMAVGSYLNTDGPYWLEGQLQPATNIELIGAGRYCDTAGEFFIYEFAPTANPPRYAINFTQYCSPGNPAKVRGILRVNSDFPKYDPNPIAVIALPPQKAREGDSYTVSAEGSRAQEGDLASYTWQQISGPEVQFVSDDADSAELVLPTNLPLGGAEVELGLTVMDSSGNPASTRTKFHVASKSDPYSFFRIATGTSFPETPDAWNINIDQEALIEFNGGLAGVLINVSEDSSSIADYTVHMDPPLNQALGVGLYENTTRFSGSYGALDFSANGFGCNEAFGSFEVSEFVFENQALKRFGARFTHYCESLSATPTIGEIGWNLLDPSVPTINITVTPDVMEGDLVTLDASSSTDGEGNIASFEWSAPSSITLSATNNPTATFTAPAISGSTPINVQFALRVTDNEGYQAEKSITVTISPEAETQPMPQAPPRKKKGGALELWWLLACIIFLAIRKQSTLPNSASVRLRPTGSTTK